MAAVEKVRIAVVGDSGVGKTSLVHLICHEESISSAAWTIGCTVEVKLYDYKEGMPGGKTFFLEFWDIGGSANHENSRSIFYNGINGLILVHDLTNRKSFTNLRKWLAEVLNASKDLYGANNKQKDSWFGFTTDIIEEYDPEQFAGNQIPVIVVGTKLDQARPSRLTSTARGMNFVEEIGADVISIDCMNVKQLRPGTANSKKLINFFDKVIERRFHSSMSHQQSVGYQDYSQKYFDRTSKRKAF
ncbi:predicted protein [Nematostella vectensis]|uniref:Rab-like protein 3 n=1 Tax=Nematostella vectensis TaxID=45351 RepID=A7RMA7_NEMVE|nr:predicted protein [Nematostella vectensis]|eukprot:XP_001639631.1 predicted protein [Nematostella vectensis]